MVSDDKHSDLLFQHYKDCHEYLVKQLGVRVRLVVALFVIEAGFVLRISYPAAFSALSGAWLTHLIGSGPSDLGKWLEPHFADSLLWFILAAFITEMYSRSLVIEREAEYMRVLEAGIFKLLNARSITRSTDFGRKPIIYIRKANTFYLFGTLCLILSVAVMKLFTEMWQARSGGLPAWICTSVDVVIFGLIVYFSVQFARAFPRKIPETHEHL